jgi:hypothetical protein
MEKCTRGHSNKGLQSNEVTHAKKHYFKKTETTKNEIGIDVGFLPRFQPELT